MLLVNCLNVLAEDDGGSSTAKIAISDGASGGDTALPDLFTGTMSYSIPIEVPPGRKGMDPGIALTYRSGNGNGWLGVGWELEVGSIQRSPRHGVDYTKNEYQLRKTGATSELVNVGGNDYQAKIEGGFTKVTQMISSVDSRPYWVATDKYGVKFTFGQTAASRQDDPNNASRIFKWCLDRVEDPNGNFMTFTYFKDAPNGQIYLERINYTGNVNGPLPVSNYVRFYLDAPYSSPDLYTTNFKVNNRYLLKTIEVKAGNNPVKAYKLSYRQSSSSLRPILIGFQEFGKDAIVDQQTGAVTNEAEASKKPSLDFGKLVDGTGLSLSPFFNIKHSQSDSNLLGDFNGDGKIDVAEVYYPYTINYSNGSSFNQVDYSGMTLSTTPTWNLVGDFDGDGKSDLFAISTATTGYVHYAENGFSKTTLSNLTLNTVGTGAWNRAGDFDGDGKTDVLAILSGASASINYSTGNGFTTILYSGLQLNGTTAGFNLVGDFDGDGKADIMSIHTATTGYIHYAKDGFVPKFVTGLFNISGLGEWNRVGDFNGDGKADVLTMQTATTAYVNYSIENGFASASYNGMQINTAGGGWNLVGDFNGDGKADLLSLFPSTHSVYLQHSTGSGFNVLPVFTNMGISPDGSGWHLVGDFGGNGKADLLVIDPNNSTLSHLYRPVATPDLIDSFSNGLGGNITVNYAPSTQYTNTQLPFPVQTVGSITSNDRLGHVAKTYYNYSGGFFHVGERDFRGFNEVSVWGPVSSDGNQTRTTTYFHQGNDTAVDANVPNVTVGYTKGQPYRKKIWGVTGVVNGNEPVTLDSSKLISETTISYKPDDNSAAPFYTPPLQVDNYLYDAGVVGKHTKSVYEFDNYGNKIREENYGDAGDPPADRTITWDYYYNLTNHVVGRPYRETVYEGIGTTVKKSSTDYYYDDLTSCTATPTNNQTPVKGSLTRVKRWLDGGDSPEKWMAYDSYGNVVCTRDPNSVLDPYGKISTVTYDSTYTFPMTVTNPLQHSVASKYYGVDGEAADKGLYGQLKSSADANGTVRSHEYDNLGRKTLENSPDGFATTWDYSGFPYYIKVTDSAQIWTYIYVDGFGRTQREERKGPDNKTIVTETHFDAPGVIRQKSLPYFKNLETPRYVTFSSDPLGRTTSVLNPDSTATRSCYSAGVRVNIDQNNHRKRQTMDAFGRLVKVEEYLNTFSDCTTESGSPYATTTYTYDVLGNLTLVTDAKGNKTEMRYDSLGRKSYMRDPDMGEWTYEYDANGNLKLQTDAKQQKIKFGYDALNRLKSKDFGADDVIDVAYTYDEPTSTYPIGRLTTMTDGSGSTKYHYDIAGRMSRTVKTVDGTGYQTSFTYELGRLKSITYPDNETITYHYDSAGNLDQAIGYATFYGFNALGQPGRVTYGNGVFTDYDYFSSNNRLKSIATYSQTQVGLISLNYDYYANGNVKSVTDSLNTAIPHSFVSESFTPYPGKPHAIGSVGSGRSFQYDNNGNMTSDGKRSLAFNVENMPTSVNAANGVVNFTYDGNGQRVKKSSPAATRVYIDNLYECSGGSCGKYIFAGNTRIALKRGAELFYYHQDHLGSTVVVTDGNGAVAGAPGNTAENIAYYPFGETRADAGVENLNHKYTSQESDYETGLYNYNARLYDPELGRFVSADSIVPAPANPQSLNRYSYVLNNPLLYTDPTGHSWKHFWGYVSIIVGAGLMATQNTYAVLAGAAFMGYGVNAVGGESEGTASVTVATYDGNSSTSGPGSGGTGSGGGSGSGNGVPIGNTGATYVGPGASAIDTAVKGGTWEEVVNSMTSINNTSAGNTSLYFESGVATGGSANGSANSSLGMADGVKVGLSGGFNAVRVAGPRAFEAVQIAGQKTGGALVDMAENGPPAAQATLALATYTLIGPVAGPVATTYALTNPQGVVDFAEALAPGPPGPNKWGRRFGYGNLIDYWKNGGTDDKQ